MTTEEYYEKNLKVGTMLKRISDGKYFEVFSKKRIKLINGKTEMEYVLETESGGRLTSSAHWIDCYFTISRLAVDEIMADCQNCVYGVNVSWFPKEKPEYACQHLDFEWEWLELRDCPSYYERPTHYDIKLSEV